MTSPWGKIQCVEGPVSLLEITSDQLARSLQEKELEKYKNSRQEEQITEIYETYEPSDTDSDAVIAQMLQAQYNQEYDTMLKRTETKFNRDSKVNISYSNYRMSSFEDPDEKKAETDDTNKDFDRFVSVEKEYASMPRCGYKKVGDTGGFDVKLNNKKSVQLQHIVTSETGVLDIKCGQVFDIRKLNYNIHTGNTINIGKLHRLGRSVCLLTFDIFI
ncbi:hypothetical protein KPH14_006687 [Odynerus spinipes]|uniref:Uncharacterized protein n=1 Tax=Odynerus spinipes TaxID=1348599 RepID=A0AAD9VSC0_9HYME|nr:hypothetical protein KPH14_006687 [Odynerus spinipes]